MTNQTDLTQVKSVLMVCMGNICRSPSAEAVLRHDAQQANVRLNIDSAGTISNHVGCRPDPRSMAAGEKRGFNFEGIRSRKVVADDFYAFDLILAMDQANYNHLIERCPEPALAKKVHLMLSFSNQEAYQEVPDPYYGGNRGFELALDLIMDASQAVLQRIQGK